MKKLSDEAHLLAEKETELERWHAECDKVGLPHDPSMLVRHHRANERLTVEADLHAAKTLLSEFAEVLREFVETEPFWSDEFGRYCTYCDGQERLQNLVWFIEHEPTCSWLRAKPLLEKLASHEKA